MIEIGTTDFLISVPSLPRNEFKRYSTQLFDAWDRRVEQILMLPDYSISLEVEEGSVKGGGKIAVALGALYLGIGNYGSFISGLQIIRGQVTSVGEALVKHATSPFGKGISTKVKKRGGALAQLQGLFNKVQNGEMTSDQAMREAEVILGEGTESAPEFMSTLQKSLETAPKFHKQILLLDESFEEETDILTVGKKKRVRLPSPKPIPSGQQYRVEIWRESKKDKKNVRVTKL